MKKVLFAIAVTAAFITMGKAQAQERQTLDRIWQLDGKTVLSLEDLTVPQLSTRDRIALNVQDTLIEFDEGSAQLMKIDLRLPKLARIVAIEAGKPHTVTMTTVLVDGKPFTEVHRTNYYHSLYVALSSFLAHPEFVPKFKFYERETPKSFILIVEGKFLTLPDCVDINDPNTPVDSIFYTLQKNDQRAGIGNSFVCRTAFLVDKCNVFMMDSKEVVYTYDYKNHEVYERPSPLR